MATRAYSSTEVPVERSQGAIRTLLRARGCDRITVTEGAGIDGDYIGITWDTNNHRIAIKAWAQPVDQDEVAAKARRSRSKTAKDIEAEMRDQEDRRIWRVIAHYVKAVMVAIDEGLLDERQAWLAHTVDPQTGRTVWDITRQPIEAGALALTGGGGMKQLVARVM